jgi:hypothetical protein
VKRSTWMLAMVAAIFLLVAISGADGDAVLDIGDDSDGLLADFAVQTYVGHAAAGMFDNTGRVWGYDPFFLGGFPAAFTWHSFLVNQLFAAAAEALTPGATAKAVPGVVDRGLALSILFLFLMIPITLAAAGRRLDLFGKPWLAVLVMTILGLCLFRADLGSLFFHRGMTTAIAVMFPSILGLVLLVSFLETGRTGDAVLLGVTAAAALLIHKISIVTLAAPGLVIAAVYVRHAPLKRYAVLALPVVGALAVNAFWLIPFFRYLGDTMFDASTSHWFTSDPFAVVRDWTDPNAKIGVFLRPTGWPTLALRWFLLVAMAHGLVSARHAGARRPALAFGVVWLLVFLFAYFGSLVPGLYFLDPAFFVVYASLLTVVGATWSLTSLISRLPRGRQAAALVLLTLVVGFPAVWRNLNMPAPSRAALAEENLAWRALAERITATPRTNGRVMFEGWNLFFAERDPLPNMMTLYGHMALPLLTDAVFLGGHYPNFFIKYNRANFSAGRLGERPIEEFSVAEFTAYLEAYNVDLIVAHSPPALAALGDRFGELVAPVWSEGPHHAFGYRPTGNYFAQGSGRVDFDFGVIRLTELQPDATGVVVIKSHHVRGLRAGDGSPVGPIEHPGAVWPFIAVHPKTASVELRL